MNKKSSIIIFWLGIAYSWPAFNQANIREVFQAKIDSIVQPYEVATDTKFGPDMTFGFKEPYVGYMREEGSQYTSKLNTVKHKEGDTIRLYKTGSQGGIFGQFDFDERFVLLSPRSINKKVVFQDSAGFWNHYEKLKKIKHREYVPYWMALDCLDENERCSIFFGASYLLVRFQKKEEKIIIELDFGMSGGDDLKGLGCAENEEAFIEFNFEDGSTLKKQNIETEYCQSMKIDVSDDLVALEKPITAMTFGMSRKTKKVLIDHEISRNQINLKLDCLLK